MFQTGSEQSLMAHPTGSANGRFLVFCTPVPG